MTLKNVVCLDTETNGFNYTKLHCVGIIHIDNSGVFDKHLFTKEEEFTEWAENNTDKGTLWVGHNICGFDWHVIEDLTGISIPKENVRDTSVLLKLYDYRMFNSFSLAEIGSYLGHPKIEYDGGWEEYSEEMGLYCLGDTEILWDILNKWPQILDQSPDAIEVEHEIAFLAKNWQDTGFKFDLERAKELHLEVMGELKALEYGMKEEWPAELIPAKTLKWRETKDGTLYLSCTKAMAEAVKWERKGDDLIIYEYKEFNPGSPQDRIDKLWEAGWKPFDKTKGHKKFEREKRYGKR